jgi:hypothetical protein
LFSISGKTNAGFRSGWRARAAAPPRQGPSTTTERDHIRRPDHPAGGQQPARVIREQLAAGQDVDDEPDGGQQVRQRNERDHGADDDPQPGSLPVDAARSPAISTVSSEDARTIRRTTTRQVRSIKAH